MPDVMTSTGADDEPVDNGPGEFRVQTFTLRTAQSHLEKSYKIMASSPAQALVDAKVYAENYSDYEGLGAVTVGTAVRVGEYVSDGVEAGEPAMNAPLAGPDELGDPAPPGTGEPAWLGGNDAGDQGGDDEDGS